MCSRLPIQLMATRIPRNTSTLPTAIDPYLTLRPWNDRPMSRHWLSGVQRRRDETGQRQAARPLIEIGFREADDHGGDDERDAQPAENSEETFHG